MKLQQINSASNDTGGGTGCNLFIFWIKYNYIDQSVVCVVYSFHMIYEYTLLKTQFLQLGHRAPWGHWNLVEPCEMILTFEPP